MEQLLLTRASTLAAFTDLLYDIGAPVDSELERCNLPVNLNHQTNLFVPVSRALDFVTAADRKEDIDDIVFRALSCSRSGWNGQNVLPAAIGPPTLFAGLCEFLDLVRFENPNMHFSIVRKQNELRIEGQFDPDLDDDELHIVEWTIILQLLSLIRRSLGADFCPEEIQFQRPFTPCRNAREDLPNARFIFGHPKTSILMPTDVLGQSVRRARWNRRLDDAQHETAHSPIPPVLDFSSSLRLAMRAYLSDGYPSINTAAEIAGVSARTLQRRLAEDDQTYSELILQARFEVASELLGQSELKIIDVAYAAGYEDPSHFSRAFRRIAGVTPLQYRRDIRAQA